jgi:hypothetical protein
MADVSVEFGAKDTGLEQTLKTVQDELTRLDEKVKGGELSFNELQSTMRRVAQAEKLQAQLEGMAQATGEAGNAAGAAAPKVDQIGQETKKAGKEAEDFGEKSKGGFLKMSGAVAAGQLAAEAAMAGIRAAINLAKGAVDEFAAALDLGGRLTELAERTGEAEGNLLLLERAFVNTGAGAEQVGPTINKLQKFMEDAAQGGTTQTAAMDKLGISLTDLQGKTPIEQMQIFADRLAGIQDPGQRAAVAMAVFGEEGAKLLPLLTDFSGSINEADGQLGSMVEVMNENARVFKEVDTKVKAVKEKFLEFASGILSEAIPAVDGIVTALSKIDAAKIGKELASAFIGGNDAMNGFQAAVDAFKTGKIREAFEILWDSIVLQAQQTANEIYKNLQAAFKTSGEVLGEIFRSDGPAANLMKQTFSGIASFIQEKLYNALADFMGAIGRLQMEEVFRYKAETAAREVERALDSIPIYAGLVAEDAGAQLAKSPELFKKNLEESGGIFTDLDEKAAALKAKQDEITAAVTKTNEEKGKGAPTDDEAIAKAEEQKRLAVEAAAEKAKMEGLQNALNAAISSGNELEQQAIEKMIEGEEAKKRIKELTDQYIATGLGEKEAGQLATNLVNAETAAANFKKNSEGAKNELGGAGENAKTVKGIIDGIAQAKMDNPPKSMNERLTESQQKLSAMKDFIGEDLNKMSLSDIMKKLGLSAPALASTDEKLKMVEDAVKKLEEADPAEITPTVDEVGVNDKLEAVKDYLAGIEKPDATPEVDEKKAVDSAKSAMDAIKSQFKSVPAEIAIDAKKSIASIREELKKEIDLSLSSSKGTEVLTGIKGLVEGMKELVGKIETKLPMQALAY